LLNNHKYRTNLLIKHNNLTLINKNKESFNIDKNFLDWLSGFTDRKKIKFIKSNLSIRSFSIFTKK
jgi:hypothetical protein